MNYVLCAAASAIAILSSKYSAEWAGFLAVSAGSLLHFLKKREMAAIWALAVFFLFLYLSSYHESHSNSMLKEGGFSGRGMLTVHPDVDGDRFKSFIKLENGETAVLRQFIESEEMKQKLLKVKSGMSCRTEGKLEAPLNPTIPNSFHYKAYLESQAIYWVMTASEITDCKMEPSLEAALLSWRSSGLERILNTFPPESAGIAQALVFGEREWISQETEHAYQRIGIIHLLAISGMQVAMIAFAGRYILIRAGVSREVSALILFIFLPAYLILAGGSPSVTRAVLAAELYLLCVILKWKLHPLSLLSVLFMMWLGFYPLHLFLTGFQLTFLISFTILLSFPLLNACRGNIHKQNFALTVLSMICTLPLILHSFWEISLLSLPVNFFYVPLYSFVIMPASLISFTMSLLQIPLWKEAVSAAHTAIVWTNQLAEFLSVKDPFLLRPGKPPGWLLAGYSGGVLFSLWSSDKGFWKRIIALAVLSSLGMVHFMLPYANPGGAVTFLDVGQGDCIVIELPYRKGVYVIDTGGKFTFEKAGEEWRTTREEAKLAEYTLLSYLASQGISRIDAVFLTHGDHDHTGEYETLAEAVTISKLIIPEGFVRDDSDRRIINESSRRGISVQTVKGGELIMEEGIHFQVLWPLQWSDSKNEDSLVLRFTLGGQRWLLTGDLEKEGEEAMLRAYRDIEIDVLKAGHHGSRFSTAPNLLNRTTPSHAVLSAGRKNRYGHPHKEVLDRLKKQNVNVYRTDEHGSIQYLFKGESGTFKTFPP
ncbi:DNA internalization-related competence protein ComEC/Rec2 [Metabacillus sp. 113a]|uniref:DNA internalization-related competence protein ComEC/Rec2 n=1 Tax=Metabacillus sp. 113a TaxID=3404706 RepID=UPI003CEF904F